MKKTGFTLIELLTVVLIISILAAIALPKYKMAVLKSRFATIKNLTHRILDAQREYYLIHNEYSTNFSDLNIDMPQDYIKKITYTNSEYYYYNKYICFTSKAEEVAYCSLTKTDGTQYLGYQIYFNWGRDNKALALCYVLGTPLDDYRDTFCQMETGRTSYATLSTNAKSYSYEFL